MLAFGDGMLTHEQILTVVAYVKSLSGREADQAAAAGAAIFADNCASCHGDAGTGNTELGAPNLTDAIWIYGGDEASLVKTVTGGHQGWMPSWEGRLTETDRKILRGLSAAARAREESMTDAPTKSSPFWTRSRIVALAAVAVCAAVFVAANAHLVMVSLASAPGCTPSLTADGPALRYRAADASC